MSKFSRKSRFTHGSKFKNVVVKPYAGDKAYGGLQVSTEPHKTGNFLTCSHEFLCYASHASNGAAVGVFQVDDFGATSSPSSILAHKGKVTDVALCHHDAALVAVSTDAGWTEMNLLSELVV